MRSAFNETTATRSRKTERAYVSRYHALKKRFEKERGIDNFSSDEVTAHLIFLKSELTMASWRVYKAAVLYVLETEYPDNEHAIDALRNESSSDLKKTSNKTSGKKDKRVDLSAWAALSAGINRRIENGHKHAKGLMHVLKATSLVGLRPNEWCFSSISKHQGSGRPVLRVRNSKHSNGRANGEFREMFIDQLNEEEMQSIEGALKYCACQNPDEATKIQKALKNEFEATRSESITRTRQSQANLTLYSFRHQFIADAKKTFENLVLISALSGHSSTKTAFKHYGKRRSGRSLIKVIPTPESVEAVQKVTLETYRQFLAKRRGNEFTI
ncbi:MAG: hypothetical protein C4516_09115 [Oxalobacter sp.]|nr:MAG: hypothetical protein C4516_09115 [Oxalobacter sp.]